MQPPRLADDCFALPPGVDWTPVDTALDLLRRQLSCVVGHETVAVGQACGRVLATAVTAHRSNPPTANSAVDGYGFAFAGLVGQGAQNLPLVKGRSAAGAPFAATVPPGHAVKILTGAVLPAGVDTVIMQEDVALDAGKIAFRGGLKPGANARDAGEDVTAGEGLFNPGHRLKPQDIALLSAVGLAKVAVFKRLRVGVLSTGDELLPAGAAARDDQIYDANRPMLMSILTRWGMEAVDLGHARDDLNGLRDCLNSAAGTVDAIVTSGGASAGEEDHLSAILNAEGQVQSWRIALKPGRPLMLGLWQGVPIFGLPGNPVAAFVCTLIFARPALGLLGGADWATARGFLLPAAFTKAKKAGRREYLRARLDDRGHVEVFQSEGSGRISGLSWADGLVELADAAGQVAPGDLVTYYPFESFGI